MRKIFLFSLFSLGFLSLFLCLLVVFSRSLKFVSSFFSTLASSFSFSSSSSSSSSSSASSSSFFSFSFSSSSSFSLAFIFLLLSFLLFLLFYFFSLLFYLSFPPFSFSSSSSSSSFFFFFFTSNILLFVLFFSSSLSPHLSSHSYNVRFFSLSSLSSLFSTSILKFPSTFHPSRSSSMATTSRPCTPSFILTYCPAEFGGNQPAYDKVSWLRTLLAKNSFQHTCETMAAVAAQLNGHLSKSAKKSELAS